MEVLEPLINYLFFWGSFAFLLYALGHYSVKDSAFVLVFYAIGTVLRYLLQNIAFIFMMGINAWESEFYVSDLLISIVLDWLVMGAAFGIAWLFHRKRMPQSIFNTKEQRLISEDLFVFSRFFDLKNSLLKCALWMAALPSAVRLLLRAWYDINLLVVQGVPVMDVGEALLIATYYVTDCAGALVGYLVIFMILSSLQLADKKARLSADA